MKDHEWIEIQVTDTYPYDTGYWRNLLMLTTDQVIQIMEDWDMVIYNSREEGPRRFDDEITPELVDQNFLNKGYITFDSDLALYRHDYGYWLLIRIDGSTNEE
jgi:hypothetical protein